VYLSQETVWREAPGSAVVGESEADLIALAHWHGRADIPLHQVSASQEDDHHILSVCHVKSDAQLIIRGRVAWDGRIAGDSLLLTGPRTDRWRAVFRGSYSTSRIYIPQRLLASCYADMFGRPPADAVMLGEVVPVTDATVRQLAAAITLVSLRGQALGIDFLANAGRALASRLLRIAHRQVAGSKLAMRQEIAPWRLKRCLDFVDAHISRSITLADLGQIACLSPMHLGAQFKKAVGMTPHSYILQRRIDRAKRLLLSSDDSAAAIGNAVGFANPAHFCTVFRKAVGHTPARWREMNDCRGVRAGCTKQPAAQQPKFAEHPLPPETQLALSTSSSR